MPPTLMQPAFAPHKYGGIAMIVGLTVEMATTPATIPAYQNITSHTLGSRSVKKGLMSRFTNPGRYRPTRRDFR
jgi:hypothetical protein